MDAGNRHRAGARSRGIAARGLAGAALRRRGMPVPVRVRLRVGARAVVVTVWGAGPGFLVLGRDAAPPGPAGSGAGPRTAPSAPGIPDKTCWCVLAAPARAVPRPAGGRARETWPGTERACAPGHSRGLRRARRCSGRVRRDR